MTALMASFVIGPLRIRNMHKNQFNQIRIFRAHHNSSSFLSDSVRFSYAKATMADSDSGSSAVDYVEIIVVRHGETAWNAERRIQGHLDVELNDAGRQQAAAVANRLSEGRKISLVYSSDLKRAYETAHTIAAKCGGLNGGGESLDQLYDRCTSALERFAGKHKGERVVVVTHGGVIRTLHQQASPNARNAGKIANIHQHISFV